MQGADSLTLPRDLSDSIDLTPPDCQPVSFTAGLVHPTAINAATTAGSNRSQLELDHICSLLAALPADEDLFDIVVDRLGGRKPMVRPSHRSGQQSIGPPAAKPPA